MPLPPSVFEHDGPKPFRTPQRKPWQCRRTNARSLASGGAHLRVDGRRAGLRVGGRRLNAASAGTSKEIPADEEGTVDPGTMSYDVIMPSQTTGQIGMTFTRNARPIGAIRFAPLHAEPRFENRVDRRCALQSDRGLREHNRRRQARVARLGRGQAPARRPLLPPHGQRRGQPDPDRRSWAWCRSCDE